MLYYKDLENLVLKHDITESNNKLFVISGYVSAEIIDKFNKILQNIQIEIIYGMYGHDSISEPLHKKFVELNNKLPNVDIKYSTVPIHSKIYCWYSGNHISHGLIGSANFTISGLRNDFKETLVDIEIKNIDKYQEYFKYIRENSIPCNAKEVIFKHIQTHKRVNHKDKQPYIKEGICRMSLLNNKNLVPKRSGLNWGCSKGHVTKGDAYIKITSQYIKLFPELFPQKKYVNGIVNTDSKGKANRENDVVELLWDDGHSMVGLMEGQITIDGILYPKQLTSSARKNELGIYLRERLGLADKPKDYVIKKKDLLKYGRTSIDISKMGDGIYYLDFSVNKKSK